MFCRSSGLDHALVSSRVMVEELRVRVLVTDGGGLTSCARTEFQAAFRECTSVMNFAQIYGHLLCLDSDLLVSFYCS
jgi:hypothetical protein